MSLSASPQGKDRSQLSTQHMLLAGGPKIENGIEMDQRVHRRIGRITDRLKDGQTDLHEQTE